VHRHAHAVVESVACVVASRKLYDSRTQNPGAVENAASQQHLIESGWMAPSRQQARKAFDRFVAMYTAKYPKATECLQKDRDALLAFYDFPAEHWIHIRTTNPVESTFATVRLRTAKTRGCVSRNTILALVFRLGLSAEKRWVKLKGFQRLG
jgi:transposase-like protein